MKYINTSEHYNAPVLKYKHKKADSYIEQKQVIMFGEHIYCVDGTLALIRA